MKHGAPDGAKKKKKKSGKNNKTKCCSYFCCLPHGVLSFASRCPFGNRLKGKDFHEGSQKDNNKFFQQMVSTCLVLLYSCRFVLLSSNVGSLVIFQFVADRIIQDFRARSQLLVSQHEEEDEVVCTLSDTSESEDEADHEPSR